MTLDAKLRWKEHIKKNDMSSTSSSGKCIGWLDAILSCQSTINSHYTSKLYVQFGVMVSSSGAALVNPIFKIQRYQNKVLKCIVNALWYVRNSDLHRDLGMETVTDIIAQFAKSREKRLQDHINIEASRLLNVNNITRRLKRKKPFELVIR
jgi:uncharacterized protein YeeX (DUF496 family)